MSSSSILKVEEFDVSEVSFSSVKENKFGIKSVRIFYNRKPLYIQLPKLKAPFGASTYKEKEKGVVAKYHLDLSFEGKEKNEELRNLYEKLADFDNAILSNAQENVSEWFGENEEEESLKSKYISCIRQKERADNFRVKFTRNKHKEFITEVYDQNKNVIELTDDGSVVKAVPKGSSVKAIVECVGVWFSNKEETESKSKFGISWSLVQMKVFPPPVSKRLSGYSFIDESESESDDENADALEPEI